MKWVVDDLFFLTPTDRCLNWVCYQLNGCR